MRKANRDGYLFEHEVAEKLKGRGFSHVKVTKASREYGADILAFKDGLEYVFQCKKFKGTVGFNGVKDVSTAMEIYRADKGVLVCDTKFSRDAYYAVSQIEKPIELIDLEKIKSWKTVKLEKETYDKPHPYQKNILTALIKHRKQGSRSALLVMATGLGKTLVAAWDLKNQIKKGQKALFLVHRKDILVDNAEKFHAVINPKEEKFKFGIYFEGKKFDRHVDVVFSTFQTLLKHHKDISRKYFDYIIIDEAHHSPASTYSELIKYFQPRFLLGITATPKRIARQDNEFIETSFGKPLVDLDLAQSLIKGYLSPVKYSVFCDNIDYEKLKSVKKKLSVDQLNRNYFIPTKDEDIERLILAEKKKLKDPKTIIFCPSIRYINSVRSIGLFGDAAVYHSNMSDFDRQIIFRRFKLGKIRTLLVVDLFNEGIDIPDANLVVFLRTTYSPTIFFQQLGRGLRKAKGKKFLRVLDFVGALSKLKKVINVFGHLLIIQDFVEKVEKQKRFSNLHRGKIYKGSDLLDPLDLSFYQAGKNVSHKETLFKRKPFLDEIKFIKKHIHKWGFWTEGELIKELEPICKQLGHFPSGQALREMGRSDLDVQIAQWGGVYYFSKKMGFNALQKPKGYWSVQRVKDALLALCKQLKRMPSRKDLEALKQTDLLAAFGDCGIKWKDMAEELGYPTKRQSRGHWTFKNLKSALTTFIGKGDTMPTTGDLVEKDRYDLIGAIHKHGGFTKVAEKLCLKLEKKPAGYWTFDQVRKELLPICRQLDHMPSINQLKKMGRGDLGDAILKLGGYPYVAKKIGYSSSIKPKGFWSLKSIKKELMPIYRKLKHMPTNQELRKLKRIDLGTAITKFGGYPVVAKKLKLKRSPNPHLFWNDERNFRKALLPICRRLKRMPTETDLRVLNKTGISVAIRKYWGGFEKAAQILGYDYEPRQKPKGFWSFARLKRELRPIIDKNNQRMPTPGQLGRLGRHDLSSAIQKKFGGYKKCREILGLRKTPNERAYYNDWINVLSELIPICKEHGSMPTSTKLREIGKNTLAAAINKYWGGYKKVSKKLGYK